MVRWNAGAVVLNMPEYFVTHPIVTLQPIGGTNPKITLLVLHQRCYLVRH
jgi:hypothetical protein